MKTKILLSLGVLGVTLLGFLSLGDKDLDKEKRLAEEAISRWLNLDDEAVLDGLYNMEGEMLMSASFTNHTLTSLLETSEWPALRFDLAVNHSGKIGFVVDGKSSTYASYESNLIDFEIGIKGFDPVVYRNQHNGLSSAEMEHLIGYDAALEMIKRWEVATDEQRIESLVTENGQRLNSLSFNKEVFEGLANSGTSEIGLILGLNDDFKARLIVVGLDDKGGMLLNDGITTNAVYDFSRPCPPTCYENYCEGCTGVCIFGICFSDDDTQLK